MMAKSDQNTTPAFRVNHAPGRGDSRAPFLRVGLLQVTAPKRASREMSGLGP
jgi:hypothetical protein